MSHPTEHMTTPMFIYHKDHPEGRIVDAGADDFDAAALSKDGWLDSPAKIKVSSKTKTKPAA